MQDAYTRLHDAMCELADIAHAQALLGWDQETNMPVKGASMRARSLGSLAGIYHDKLTGRSLVDLVAELKEADLTGDQAVNLRELDREQRRACKMPRRLVVELSETASLGHEAWVQARERADFAHYRPWLEKMLGLKRKVAEIVGHEGSIYNALLDEYEPYALVEEIAPLFSELRQYLASLVAKISAAQRQPPAVLDQPFPIAQQEQFGRRIMAAMGFDLDAGRLDVSVHPFCSGIGPEDVRLTTRYDENGFTQSLFGIIHETGHGLYEQGLPSEAGTLPAGRAVSLGVHESQSRLWENVIGRSRPFWSHYLPALRETFPAQLDGIDLEAFYRAINRVEPSLIRVEADEVTYNLHILLRFELERELLAGELAVAELPDSWNQRMEAYLGIRPPDDALGVLQDVHWALGLFGYFPTYTLGNLYAAQFYERALDELPELTAQVSRGELLPLKAWLNRKIHQRGSRLKASDLVVEVTGKNLQIEPFLRYLEQKFSYLYGLKG